MILSDNERAQLKAQHRRERDKRVCDRIKAVLLYDKGWSISTIAEALFLSDDTIREHVLEYQSPRKLKIKLHFLPPYSPNLNPIERLWKWMKERVIYNAYYREIDDFRSAVLVFFDTLGHLPADSVLGQNFRSRVRDKFSPVNLSRLTPV